MKGKEAEGPRGQLALMVVSALRAGQCGVHKGGKKRDFKKNFSQLGSGFPFHPRL